MFRPRVLAGIALFVVTASVFGGIAFYHRTTDVIADSYAVWWVGDMVNSYLDEHPNSWPQGWDDLRRPYDQAVAKSGNPGAFDELRARVEIDWNADPNQLVKAKGDSDHPPFRAVWLKDGRSVYWAGEEPNQIIWEHLQSLKINHDSAESGHQNPPATNP